MQDTLSFDMNPAVAQLHSLLVMILQHSFASDRAALCVDVIAVRCFPLPKYALGVSSDARTGWRGGSDMGNLVQ